MLIKLTLSLLIIFAPFNIDATCPIFLSISLTGKTIYESFIEINWGPDCDGPPEWIGIFRQDPSISSFLPEYRIDGISNKTGKLTTHIKVGKLNFPGGWNRNDNTNTQATKYSKGKCLPHYVASYNGTELLSVECLKIQPNWFAQLKGASKVPIKRLFLPGTHASGAFVGGNLNKTKPLIKDFLVSQHFDVWSQLVFGIRYLDLSIGYNQMNTFNEADNFWIMNENMFITPLIGILDDVRRFVQRSGELVVLDFSSFPVGFYKHPEVYSSLYRLIHRELQDVAYERNSTNSLDCFDLNYEELRVKDRTILILFPTEELPHPENESEMLCAPWKRFTTSFMNNSQALDYMRLLFSKKVDSPVQDEGWIFLAVRGMEQTLNDQKLQNIKERAALFNPKVCQWLKGPWGLNANVVAMDYFSNTNIIDVAIHVNAHKAFLFSNPKLINLEILNR